MKPGDESSAAPRRKVRNRRLLYNSLGGGSTPFKRQWSRGYGEGFGALLIFAPVWMPPALGEGFRWPRLEDVPLYLGCFVVGVGLIWWENRPAAKREDADDRRHKPGLEAADGEGGTTYFPVCSCGWEGTGTPKENDAVRAALRHMGRPGAP